MMRLKLNQVSKRDPNGMKWSVSANDVALENMGKLDDQTIIKTQKNTSHVYNAGNIR